MGPHERRALAARGRGLLWIRFVCRGGPCGPSSETPNLVGGWSDAASLGVGGRTRFSNIGGWSDAPLPRYRRQHTSSFGHNVASAAEDRGSARNNRQKCSRAPSVCLSCEPYFRAARNIQQVFWGGPCGAAPQAGEAMRLKAGAAMVGGRTLPKRKGWVGGRTRFGTRTTGSTWANEANPVADRYRSRYRCRYQGRTDWDFSLL